MSHDHHSSSPKPVVNALVAILMLYAVSVAAGLPQRGTELLVESHEHEEHLKADASEHQARAARDEHHDGPSHDAHGDRIETEEHYAHGEHPPGPPYWTVVPFCLLLGAIAVFPLLRFTEHWWESNLHRFYVAAGLAIVTLLYYGLLHGKPIEGHFPAHHLIYPSAGGLAYVWEVFANAILHEYVPFIVLLFSLYTISGGIRIEGDLKAHPMTNVGFIAVGGGLASFIGTTGAAMLLIRPLLETNQERKHVRHTVIFFIFVVCNCGGLLLPIGDPPLFLGYLRGVPFTWTFSLWQEWLFVNSLLLVVYWAWDYFLAYPSETKADIEADEQFTTRLRFQGVGLNGPLLLGVILSVALLDPSKELPGAHWHPWMYLREVVQLGLVTLSLALGNQGVRQSNRFNYHAIVEVAALFCGIFICMQPALQILAVVGDELNIASATRFFWFTGGLSAVLDNAPTYVVFFETAKGVETTQPLVAGVGELFLAAISLGAVFMGAMTYIGNGPNFMVKAIAEKSGVRMPSFFGYMKYSLGILLPILLLASWLFLGTQ